MPDASLKHKCGDNYSIEKLFDTYSGKIYEIEKWLFCRKCKVYSYNNQEFKTNKEIINIIKKRIANKEMKKLEDIA